MTYSEFAYKNLVRKRAAILVTLFFLLAFLILFSVSIGTLSLSLNGVCRVLAYILASSHSSLDPLLANVIINLRLPRVLMGVIAGVCFGVSGVVLQVVLRNPLASPYTMGVASSASFGAALAIILGAGVIGWRGESIIYTNPYVIVANAFLMSLLCSSIVAFLSLCRGASSGTTILAGIAMTYLFSASTSLLQYFGSTEQVAALVFWMFGDLGKAEWADVTVCFIVALAIIPVVLKFSNDYDALMLGDDVALSLGVNVKFLRVFSVALASLLTAAPTAFIGTVGFIGLLAPHIARLIIGSDHKFLVPASALIGAILLLSADTAARTILSPLILPVGVLTAFMGVPLFLHLLLRRGVRYW